MTIKKLKNVTALFLATCMTMIAPITISAEEKTVKTLAELNAAISDGNTINLGADITGNIVIPAGTSITLNLNDCTFTNGNTDDAIINNGNLTITGEGKIVNETSGKGVLVNMPGANATISGGTLQGKGWYTIKNLGTMTISKRTTVTSDDAKSSLIANGWYGSQPNDRNTAYVDTAASLTISGGNFNGGMNTVKNDDYGVLKIENGTFTNTSGPTILNWNETTITGGTFDVPNGFVLANGYLSNTGDQGKMTITGGTFTSGNGGEDSLFGYGEGTKPGGAMEINGGTFKGNVVAQADTYEVQVNRGTFTKPVAETYITSGKTAVSLTSKGDTNYLIGTGEEVADALVVAEAGDSVKILQGDMDLSDIANGVTVTNDGTGNVVVNGTALNKGDDPVVTHTHEVEAVAAKAADCKNDGNIAYWHCTGCDKYYSDSALTDEITQTETIVKALGHAAVKVEAKAATDTENGNIAYWYCKNCNTYFSDAALTKEIKKADTMIKALGHTAVKVDAWEATCTQAGNIAYWYCKTCEKYFSDAALTNEIRKADTIVDALGHDVVKVEAKAATATKAGNIAFWYCIACDTYYRDAALTEEIKKEDTIVAATGTDGKKPVESDITTDAETAKHDQTPNTGDTTNPMLWAFLMLGAAGLAGGIYTSGKRKIERS